MSPATAACATPESAATRTTEQSTTRRDMRLPSGSTGLSPGTRTAEPVITHHGAVRDVWPHLAKRLSAYLRRRGASWHDTDDIVQECALRVLSREVAFADADDLMSWCLTVARNVHVDLHRGQGRLSTESVPDRPADGDVHEEVASRLRLQAVVDAWPRLSPADQRVLVEAVEEVPAPTVRRDAVRLYAQRNRGPATPPSADCCVGGHPAGAGPRRSPTGTTADHADGGSSRNRPGTRAFSPGGLTCATSRSGPAHGSGRCWRLTASLAHGSSPPSDADGGCHARRQDRDASEHPGGGFGTGTRRIWCPCQLARPPQLTPDARLRRRPAPRARHLRPRPHTWRHVPRALTWARQASIDPLAVRDPVADRASQERCSGAVDGLASAR